MGYELYGGLAIMAVAVIAILFFLVKFTRENNNPYMFSQYFDKSLVKVKMYEVDAATYSEGTARPVIEYTGEALYGQFGLFWRHNVFPVTPAMMVKTGARGVSLFYKAGGKKTITPLLVTVFYNEQIKKEEAQEIQAIEKNKKPAQQQTGFLPFSGSEPAKDEPVVEPVKEMKGAYTLGILTPAREQLEMMTDNFIDNFLTRQQSIAMQVLNQAEMIVRSVVPIGLVLVVVIAITAIGMVFGTGAYEKALENAKSVCGAFSAANIPQQNDTSSLPALPKILSPQVLDNNMAMGIGYPVMA